MNRFTRFFRVLAALSTAVMLCSACLGAPAQQPAHSASLAAPAQAIEMGRSFDLRLTFANAGGEEALVREIRVPAAILQAFRYLGSLPAVTLERMADGSGVLRTQLVIPPQSSADFVLRFQAIFSGVYEENFSVLFGDELLQLPARLQTRGSIPAGWLPGPASARGQTAATEGLPEAALVRVKALVNVEGTLVEAWSASGVFISRDGLILTSARAVVGSRAYPVADLIVALQSAPGTAPVDAYLASIVQVDEARDAALIKPRSDLLGNRIPPGSLALPAAALGESSTVLPGEALTLLGYPSSPDAPAGELSAAVTSLSPEEAGMQLDTIMTNLPPGGDYFGWAAFNSRGELVGLASAPDGTSEQACGALVDTNRDDIIDEQDACLPAGGNLQTLSSVQALGDMFEEAWMGQVGLRRVSVSGFPFEMQGQVVFRTDFSDPLPAWPAGEQNGARSAYDEEAFTLTLNAPRSLFFTTLDYAYEDILLRADARVLAGSGDGDFGFICGYRDETHFTALEVSEDAYFSIWKRAGEETSVLVDWTYADALAADGSLRLSAQCGAGALRLAANGLLLAEITDPGFFPGPVGILAGTSAGGTLKIAFDNLEILIPGAE